MDLYVHRIRHSALNNVIIIGVTTDTRRGTRISDSSEEYIMSKCADAQVGGMPFKSYLEVAHGDPPPATQ